MQLTEEEIRQIESYLLVRTPIRRADLCFVFGARAGEAAFAAETARLWRAGLFPRVIVSGGNTPGGDEPEAVTLRRRMIAEGIPAGAILIETEARHSGENVMLSLPILEREIGLARIRSVIAVGQFHTSRRYLMTLERYWPGIEKMLVTVESHGIGRADWHRHPEFISLIRGEMARIEPYLARNIIAEIDPATCTLL